MQLEIAWRGKSATRTVGCLPLKTTSATNHEAIASYYCKKI